MRWLGIDAGGTKTAFATYDETQTQLDRFELPTSHYAQAGFDGMEAVLAEGIARAEAAGLLGEQYGIGIGMCGYGEESRRRRASNRSWPRLPVRAPMRSSTTWKALGPQG